MPKAKTRLKRSLRWFPVKWSWHFVRILMISPYVIVLIDGGRIIQSALVCLVQKWGRVYILPSSPIHPCDWEMHTISNWCLYRRYHFLPHWIKPINQYSPCTCTCSTVQNGARHRHLRVEWLGVRNSFQNFNQKCSVPLFPESWISLTFMHYKHMFYPKEWSYILVFGLLLIGFAKTVLGVWRRLSCNCFTYGFWVLVLGVLGSSSTLILARKNGDFVFGIL